MKRLSPLFGLLIAVAQVLAGQGMGLQDSRRVVDSDSALEHPERLPGTSELQALIRQQRWREAGVLAEQAAQKKSGSGSAWYVFGLVRFAEHRYTDAVRALRQAEKLKADHADVNRLLGLCYYFLQQYHLFEQQMEKGKASEPLNGEFDYLLGSYYQSVLGDCTRAIPAFDKAISLHFSGFKVLYHRGDCYDQNGDPVQAEKDLLSAVRQIRKRSAGDSWPFQALARLYLRTGRPNEAVSLAREAVGIEGGSADNHIVFAKALTEKGDAPAAVAELIRAVELNPSDEGARYQLYRLYLKLGEREAAQRELAAFRKLTGAADTIQNSR